MIKGSAVRAFRWIRDYEEMAGSRLRVRIDQDLCKSIVRRRR